MCVTINYRVGAEGFLYLGDATANLGQLDQIAALEWVQENIADFGDDSGKVAILRESAGAMSVATLLAMPRANGLFRRAIAANALCRRRRIRIRGFAAFDGRLSEVLGVAATTKAIATIPPERIRQVQAKLRP